MRVKEGETEIETNHLCQAHHSVNVHTLKKN